jgi:hypothetical protein
VRRLVRRSFALVVVTACSSGGGSSGPPPKAYVDQAGRQCTTTNTAAATCNDTPDPTAVTCSAPYVVPCWTLVPADQSSGPMLMENCAGCCTADDSAAESSPPDCSPIVCQTAADCPLDFNTCQSGVCAYD